MPKRSRTKRSKSRTGRRKRYKKNLKFKLLKSPLPKSFLTKLKYYTTVQLNPSAGGTPAVHVFSGNGMYDPNITGVGNQPRGFDQFMKMFDHFTVLGSKIKARFSASGSLSEPLVVGVTKRDDLTLFSNVVDYQEYGYNKSKQVSPGTSGIGFGYKPPVVTMVGTYKFLGRSKPMSDSQLKGDAAANPIEQWFYHLYAYPVQATDSAAVNVEVWIDYTCVFHEPKLPAQS